MKPYVEIAYASANDLFVNLYYDTDDTYYRIVNALNKLPVIRHTKRENTSIVSLYYLTELQRLLVKRGVDVLIQQRVFDKHKKLMKKLKRKPTVKDFQYPSLWNTKEKLEEYQKEAVSILLKRHKFVIADEMGLGKTIEAIATILCLFDQGYNKAMIVCPNALSQQWKSEILNFSKLQENDICLIGEKFKCPINKIETFRKNAVACKDCENFNRCDEIKNTKASTLRKYQIKDNTKKIIIANYSILHDIKSQVINKKNLIDIIVLDESSKLKNYNTRITRTVNSIARKLDFSDYLIPMSGTVIENSLVEIFPTLNILDSSIFGNYTNFKNRFLIVDYSQTIVGEKNEQQLKGIIKNFVIRRTADKVWKDRPGLLCVDRRCSMGEKQKEIYDKVSGEIVEELEDLEEESIYNSKVVTLMLYCIMVAGTAESVEELGKNTAESYSGKIAMLKEILKTEMVNEHVVLFSKFAKKIIPVISREFKKEKITHDIIVGGTKNKDAIIKRFKKKEFRVLICSDTMSYGANLQFASRMINFDLPWNPAVLDQRLARIYRKGQTKKVKMINLISKESLEEYVRSTIYKKYRLFDEFIGKGVVTANVDQNVTVSNLMDVLL